MKKEYNGVVGILFTMEKPLLFALVHNQNTGNITFPGGARENNEDSSKKTLARELLEETGLREDNYKASKIPFIHEFTYGPRKKGRTGIKAVQHVYLVETNKKEIIPLHKDAKFHGWHTKEEVLKLLTFDDSKDIFKKALKLI